MEEKAVRGAPWSLLTYGSTRLILLVNTVILARLLQPSDFGVLALAILAVGVFGFLGELGLGSAFTVRQDLSREEQGTVLSLMLVAGGATAAIVALASPAAAAVFDEPRLAPVLAVLSTSLFINGFTWFYEQVLLRELEFRRRFVAMLALAVGNVAIAIPLALLGAGVWSLVVGHVGGMVIQGVVQLGIVPYRVRLRWSWPVARMMIAAGRGFMVLGGLTFVRQNVDYFAVARILGSRPLGFYSMAYRLSDLPAAGVAGPISKVTFPAFARMRAQERDPAPSFRSTIRLVSLVTTPMGLVLSACAGVFTSAVFGDRWQPMAGALAVFGIWAAVRPLQLTYSWYLNALGRAGTSALMTAISLVILLPGTLLAASSGIRAVAWVMLGESIFTFGLYALAVGRFGVPLRSQLQALRPALLAAPGAWLAGAATASATDGLVPVAGLAAAVAALGATYVVALALLAPTAIRDVSAVARRILAGSGRTPAEGVSPTEASPTSEVAP